MKRLIQIDLFRTAFTQIGTLLIFASVIRSHGVPALASLTRNRRLESGWEAHFRGKIIHDGDATISWGTREINHNKQISV